MKPNETSVQFEFCVPRVGTGTAFKPKTVLSEMLEEVTKRQLSNTVFIVIKATKKKEISRLTVNSLLRLLLTKSVGVELCVQDRVAATKSVLLIEEMPHHVIAERVHVMR